MRSVIVALVSVLAVAGSAAHAQTQQDLPLRGPLLPQRADPEAGAPETGLAVAATTAARPAGDPTQAGAIPAPGHGLPDDENAPIPPMPPAPATVSVKTSPKPWCPSGRTAGIGAGFCLVN